MKESEDDIEDLFRERFSEDEAPVSPKVWNTIKQTLPEVSAPVVFWNGRNILLSGITAVIIVGTSWFIFEKVRKTESNIQTLEQATTDRQNTISSVSMNENNTNGTIDSFARKEKSSETHVFSRQNEMAVSEEKQVNEDPLHQNNGTTGTSTEKREEKYNTATKEKSKTFWSKELRKIQAGEKKKTDGKKQKELLADKDEKGRQEILKQKKGDKKNSVASSNLAGGKSNKLSGRTTSIAGTGNKTTDVSSNLSSERSLNKKGKYEKINALADSNQRKENNSFNSNSSVREAGRKAAEKNYNADLVVATDNARKDINQKKEHQKQDVLSEESKDKTRMQTEKNELTFLKATDSVDFSDPLEKKRISLQDKTNTQKNSVDIQSRDTVRILPDDLAKVTMKENSDSLKTSIAKDSLTQNLVDSTGSKDTTEKKKEENPTRTSRWTVDLLLSPAFTGVATKAGDATYESLVAAKNGQDKNQLTMSGGATVNYTLNSKWYVSAGIFYSAYSEKYNFKNSVRHDSMMYNQYQKVDTTYKDSIGFQVIDTITMKTVTDSTNLSSHKEYSAKKKDKYSFLSFPVSVSYCFLKRNKFSLSATAGVRINLLLKNTAYFANQEMTELVEYKWSINKVTLSYMASVSMEYQLWKNMYLLAQPTVNYHAGSVYGKSSPVSQKPYSIGVNVGVRLRF